MSLQILQHARTRGAIAFRPLSLFLLAAVARGAPPAPDCEVEPPLDWHDVTAWGVEGRAFEDMNRESWFDRLPEAAKGRVTDIVWDLSQDSAGMLVRFRSDTSTFWVDYELRRDRLAEPNMSAIGASGLDFYARDTDGTWKWAGVAMPRGKKVHEEIASGYGRVLREFMVYLPLYNGVTHLSIGTDAGSRFEPIAPRREKPVVFYGTSITQGAAASRPGMVHTAILGRRLDWPVVNLGFSGHGLMEASVGEFLVRIDAAVYIIDCLPNMNAAMVRERCIPLVKQIRAARPDTPIVLVEDRRRGNTWMRPDRTRQHDENHAALRECYTKLQSEGVTGLFYIPGDHLLGDDTNGIADGSHPNDLGFLRQADVFEPVLREALDAERTSALQQARTPAPRP